MLTTTADRTHFETQGYCVAKALFEEKEVAEIREHFMRRRAEGPKPGDMGGDSKKGSQDPLNQFARMINMHRWDSRSQELQQDPRLAQFGSELIGDEVVLNQTMLYFKPPGARGQALHQDNQYIRLYPIVAAWLALDDCDEANGQMTMVPGSNRLGILPVQRADLALSFTSGETILPEGARPVGVAMRAGDVLYFGGFTIHGSYPNRTSDRFRRTFIAHFTAAHAKELPADPKTMMSALAGMA